MNADSYILKLIDAWSLIDRAKLVEAIDFLNSSFESTKKIFVVGNGGSSSTASHFVNDWIKTANSLSSKSGHVVCLSDNVPMITAIANDIEFDEIFSFQLKALAKKGDVLVCISGSGNSKNVIRACETARDVGLKIVALTGFEGGEVRKIADYNFHCPIHDMQIVEDMHLSFGHMVVRCSDS